MSLPNPASEPRLHPVIIVGAGLGGSAAAAFLSRAGVCAVTLERHDQPTARPRAWIISARTQELLRELGLDEKVRTAGSAGSWNLQVVDSLQDVPPGPPATDETADLSPAGAAMCDQDVVEDILRDYATGHGAEVRWGQTVTGLADRGDHVEVACAAGPPLRARQVILAEGARSELLAGVGITSVRPDAGADIDEFDQVLFRSDDLDQLMAGKPGKAFFCQPTETIVFRRDLRRWQAQRQGRRFADIEADIAAAAGQRVRAEILDRFSWRPAAQLADTFRAGRVFVIGDAAHSMPPSIGMAGNLAVADAHNLAWKLAFVLAGQAGAGLLDSYDAERRPVDEFVLQLSLAGMRGEDPLDLATVQLGLGYPPGRSGALCGTGSEVVIADPRNLTPVTGARLPHQWLPDGRSTLDLAGPGTFAAVGPSPAPGGPAGAFPQVSYHQVPFGQPARPGSPGSADVWLVRPDGHVAAQVLPENLGPALAAILSRGREG